MRWLSPPRWTTTRGEVTWGPWAQASQGSFRSGTATAKRPSAPVFTGGRSKKVEPTNTGAPASGAPLASVTRPLSRFVGARVRSTRVAPPLGSTVATTPSTRPPRRATTSTPPETTLARVK